MSDRKRRSQDGNATGNEKRPRSTLPFRKNAAWGTGTTALQLADHTRTAAAKTELDHGMEEAIAALLEIGCTKRKQKSMRKPQLERVERPSLFMSTQLAPRAAKTVEKLMVADGNPSTSSGSDGSTAIALTRNSESKSARTSFDSVTCPAGPVQHRIVRQDSVKLLNKEPLEVRINCSGQDSELKWGAQGGSPPRTAAAAAAQEARQALALPQQVAPRPAAAVQASPHWNSRISAAAVITSKLGCAIVSTGVPEGPNSRTQVSSLSKAGLAQQPSSGAHLPQQLLRTVTPAQQHSRPVASFSGGRLIVISAPPPAAPNQLPVSMHPEGITVADRVVPSSQPRQRAAGSDKKTADKPLWQSATASAAKAGAGAGASSGDESCDDTWQSNWGLDLFSALNPSVITTGHCTFREGS